MAQVLQTAVAGPGGAWPERPAGRIPLLDVDPDLGNGERSPRLNVAVFRFPTGPLPPAPEFADERPLGYLVLKGLLLYEAAVCGRAAAELIGPGEIVRPASQYASGTIATHASWSVLAPALLADLSSLDHEHAGVVMASLACRAADRAERAAVERSICSHVRVDVRVLAYLWHLADRFGVVVPGGVRLELPLTHAIVARLVGARRPTVTTALQRLIQLGYLAREGRAFRLIGDAGSIEDLDRRSPARDFAYPDGGRDLYRFQEARLH